MKKLWALWTGLTILTAAASGQTVAWEIKQHSTDINMLEVEVTDFMNRGYVPLGITYDENELYILYVHAPDLEAKGWRIEWYDKREDIENGITSLINKGYIPTGITYTGEMFYVLYVEVENNATAWQLTPSGTSLSEVEAAIQPWVERVYVPVGITFFQDEYWTLLLKIPNTTVTEYLIESYEVGTHSDHINANIRRGFFPWGLEYSGNKRIDILYVKF